LCNLKELHSNFKNSHPRVKVRFPKSASLHAKICIWQAQVVHTVCVRVCTIHQNVKFMMETCKISKLIRRSEHHLSMYQHCLSTICTLPQDVLFSVTAVNVQENTLGAVFTDNATENITFKKRISTNMCALVTTVK
jgi:hypothetical protein